MKLNLFLFVILISCKAEKNEIVGIYSSNSSTLHSLVGSINNEIYTVGTSLNIKKDSTFIKKTCANIIEGKWEIKKDSLLLYCKTNKYIIDSLNNIPEWKDKLKVNSEKPEVFLKKGNVLKANHLVYDNNKESVIIERLKRN